MAKILSFLSWNVENFHNEPARVNRVVDKLVEKTWIFLDFTKLREQTCLTLWLQKCRSIRFL